MTLDCSSFCDLSVATVVYDHFRLIVKLRFYTRWHPTPLLRQAVSQAPIHHSSDRKAVTRVKPYMCTMPLRMDEGWNQIQFNLADFTKRAYGTNYVETLRVQVHANCRLRRIYFSDRLYSEEELPPEFKLYLPMQV
ncbi:Cilia- and flagella-associated protein 20 [Glycine soja]|uniref:Cilia-and flagella-associated protein 20 n=2 Tax=Glycine soja TaxID=3848 RepID=A0A445I6S7_GLYSO|nr:Cilia- and flagella-associated protein 20 [Glycine soja]